MSKLLLCSSIFIVFLVMYGQGDNMIGPGIWNIISISKYEPAEDDCLEMDFDIQKRKWNRTHDAYNGTCDFQTDFDETHAVHVDICKFVDGGCKQYQVLSDDSVARFAEKYAKENVKNFLELAGVDPPEFPIKAGTYKMENYVIDYCKMPPKGPYGEYLAVACILKDTKKVGCVVTKVEFIEDEDNICNNEEDN